jgi:RNA recognition motif-containing protein
MSFSATKPARPDEEPSNVFVNYLPRDFTKESLVDLGSPYGRITSAKVMIDLQTGESRCFGFVKYDCPAAARGAAAGLDGRRIGSKVLMARISRSSENVGRPSPNVLAKSLSLALSRRDVWALLRPYGQITALDYIQDANGGFKGKALVSFASVDGASRAIQALNHSKVSDDAWPIFLKFTEKVAVSDVSAFDSAVVVSGIRVERKVPPPPAPQARSPARPPPPALEDWMDTVFGGE